MAKVNLKSKASIGASRALHAKEAAAQKKKITLAQRARNIALGLVARRDRQLKALEKSSAPPVEKALAFARANVGRHEDSGRPNRAAWLDKWAREIGAWMVGQPWCGLAVWKMAKAGGVTLSPLVMSTIKIRELAQKGQGGFKAWHPASAIAQPGWVPVYGTASTGPVHTGFTGHEDNVYEGNTSPAAGGSQNDGGGFYKRSKAQRRSWVLGYAEIDWSKAKK